MFLSVKIVSLLYPVGPGKSFLVSAYCGGLHTLQGVYLCCFASLSVIGSLLLTS